MKTNFKNAFERWEAAPYMSRSIVHSCVQIEVEVQILRKLNQQLASLKPEL